MVKQNNSWRSLGVAQLAGTAGLARKDPDFGNQRGFIARGTHYGSLFQDKLWIVPVPPNPYLPPKPDAPLADSPAAAPEPVIVPKPRTDLQSKAVASGRRMSKLRMPEKPLPASAVPTATVLRARNYRTLAPDTSNPL